MGIDIKTNDLAHFLDLVLAIGFLILNLGNSQCRVNISQNLVPLGYGIVFGS